MPIKDNLLNLNQKIPWNIVSVALAIIFGTLTVYQAFYQQKRPALTIETLSNTSVLDVKEDVAGLDIQYDKRDIRKSQESLRVITVRIENTGNQSILQSFYDNRDPFGIKISRGKLIEEPTVLAASTDYISGNLAPRIDGNDVIFFSDVILDVDQFFVIKLLLLHDQKGEPPAVEKELGTIARVKSVTLLETPGEKPKKGVWKEAFSGSIWIQVMRFAGYFIGMIFVVICIIAPPAIISQHLTKRRRKNTVADYRLGTDVDLSEKDDFLFNEYIEQGSTYILRVERLFGDTSLLNSVCNKLRGYNKTLDPADRHEIATREATLMHVSIRYADRIIALLLLRHGYIVQESEDTYKITDHAKQVLDDFSKYLRKRKLIAFSDRFNHSSAISS